VCSWYSTNDWRLFFCLEFKASNLLRVLSSAYERRLVYGISGFTSSIDRFSYCPSCAPRHLTMHVLHSSICVSDSVRTLPKIVLFGL